MINVIDNRKSKDYKPQIMDLNIGEFFEYDNQLYVLVYEGSSTNFGCFNFHTGFTKYFCGIEEVEVIKNITVTIENN